MRRRQGTEVIEQLMVLTLTMLLLFGTIPSLWATIAMPMPAMVGRGMFGPLPSSVVVTGNETMVGGG